MTNLRKGNALPLPMVRRVSMMRGSFFFMSRYQLSIIHLGPGALPSRRSVGRSPVSRAEGTFEGTGTRQTDNFLRRSVG